LRIKDPSRAVVAHGSQQFAVRAERHGVDNRVVAGEGVQRFSAVGIPDEHFAIVAAGSELFAVGTVSQAGHELGMAWQRANLFTAVRIPNLDLLAARAGDRLAIRLKRDGPNGFRMIGESSQLTAGLSIPNLDRAVFARRGEPAAVRAEG